MTKEKSLEGKQKENFLGPTFLKFPGKVWADKINVLLSSVVVGELEDLYKEGVEREDLLEYMQTLPEFRELYKEMVKIAKDFSVEYVSVLKKRSKDDVGEMMKVISKFTETGASVRLYLKKNGNKDFVRSEVVSSFVEMFFQTALISALNVVYDKDQELGSSGFDALGNSVKTKAELKKLMLPAFTAIALQPPMSVMDFYKALGQLTKSLKGLGDVKLDEELLVYKNEIEVVKIDCLNGLEICIYPPNFFSKTESKINHSKAFVLVIKNKKDFPTDETMLSRVGRVTHPGFSFFGGYDQDSGTKFFGNNNFEDVMGAQEIQVSNPMFEPVERAIYLEFDTAVDDFLMLGTFVPVISEEGNLSGLISTEMYLSFKNAIFAKVNEMLLLAGVRRSEKNDKEERAAEELFVEGYKTMLVKNWKKWLNVWRLKNKKLTNMWTTK